MQNLRSLIIALVVGIAVGTAFMMLDKSQGGEWVVSPQQIEQAKAEGKPGYESSPGTIAVLPIRSETADVLPFRWTMYGLLAAVVTFLTLRKKKTA